MGNLMDEKRVWSRVASPPPLFFEFLRLMSVSETTRISYGKMPKDGTLHYYSFT